MTIHVDNVVDNDDTTWIITGTNRCNIHGCSQPAAIIDDIDSHDRFCIDHTAAAATIALHNPAFGSWYRITASHYDHRRLILTVHPL